MPNIQFDSPFNVPIHLEAASIGERYVAGFVDLVLMIVSIWLPEYLVTQMISDADLDQWSMISIFIITALPGFFYHFLCELISKGSSPGKYLMKIKVVSAQGDALSFGQCLIRWVLYWLDAFVLMSMVGLLSMIFGSKVQRLGDRAAGTWVIKARPSLARLPDLHDETEPSYQVQLPLVIRLSDADMQRIRTAYERATAQGDHAMILRLAAKIQEVTGQSNPFDGPREYIGTTIADYRYLTSKA